MPIYQQPLERPKTVENTKISNKSREYSVRSDNKNRILIKKKKPEEIKNEIDSDYNRLILNLGASYKELTLDKL